MRAHRQRRLAGSVLLGAALAATHSGAADARPVVDHYAGSDDRDSCTLAYTHDRGYLYMIEVVRGGEVKRRVVRSLPRTSPYTLVDTIDLGLVRTFTCEYLR